MPLVSSRIAALRPDEAEQPTLELLAEENSLNASPQTSEAIRVSPKHLPPPSIPEFIHCPGECVKPKLPCQRSGLTCPPISEDHFGIASAGERIGQS